VNVRTQSASSVAAAQPPFRAEHIGSLLRPAKLLRQRARFASGEISAAELGCAEDEAIADAIRMQEQFGFKFVTDGEFRRRSYHSFFYGALGQLRIDTIGGAEAAGADGTGGRGAQPVAIIGSRVQWTRPINADDATFLKTHSQLWPKITIPGPCALHFRGGDAAVTARAYHDVDQFWSDIVTAFTRELHALAAAGCRYVQIDEDRVCEVRRSAGAGRADGARRPLECADRQIYRRDQPGARCRAAGHAHRYAPLPR
jgi:methionine synthase II (cobalamin-independent)